MVIGGGLAGLSSAVALAEAGLRVRLLEKRPHLGGRAASYALPGGEHVDNCQHVTLGCCSNLEDFYRRAGAANQIRYFDRLLFAAPDGQRGSIAAVSLPPPLHMAPSFASYPLLGWADKYCIARALLAIALSGGRPADLASGVAGENMTMLAWLRRHGQTERAIRRFWEVILVSALDEGLDRIDARYGIDVFWKAFLSTRGGYRMGIPSVPLGELYEGCSKSLAARGGDVELRAGVRGFVVADGGVNGVEREDGSVETADYYLSAVPQDVLPEFLPAEIVERELVFSNLRNLKTSPITGVHLWFDRTVMSEPFLTLLDSTTQWVFNKTQLYGGSAQAGGKYLQLVISASYSLTARSRQEIISMCLEELREVLPAIRDATLVKGTVVKEMSATFSPAPGSDQWRPAQKSPLSRLFLAGDWTSAGWPSTMEGAVRSGYLAAEAILSEAGTPRKLLQPDLRAEGFARLWARESGVSKNARTVFDPHSTTTKTFTWFPHTRLSRFNAEYERHSRRSSWTGSISIGAIKAATSPRRKINARTKAIHVKSRSVRARRAWWARLRAHAALNCGTVLQPALDPKGKCPRCAFELHCCKQCAYFDSAARFECMQTIPDQVARKDQRNECTFYEFRTTIEKDTAPSAPSPAPSGSSLERAVSPASRRPAGV